MTLLQTKRLINVYHTPHAAHACICLGFTDLEKDALDYHTQSQLVRAASSSAISSRGDIGDWVTCDLSIFDSSVAESCVRFERGVLNPPWGAIPPHKLPDMGCAPT